MQVTEVGCSGNEAMLGCTAFVLSLPESCVMWCHCKRLSAHQSSEVHQTHADSVRSETTRDC